MLIEWPDCLPGLEVSVDLNSEKIVCHLQVDWLILEVSLHDFAPWALLMTLSLISTTLHVSCTSTNHIT